jgi:hypothetical protein
MTNERTIQNDLDDLLNHQSGICISLIFPTEPAGSPRASANLHIDKMIEKARVNLLQSFDHEKIHPVLKNLDILYQEMDFLHVNNGIGFYVSENFRLLVHFPFPVTENIMVGKQFATRDLLYYRSFDMPWLLVSLSNQEIRLFKGRWNKLSEIRDGVFPSENENEYEYSKPVRSTSFAGEAHVKMFEKDKTEIETTRLTDFYKKTCHLLTRYMENNMPVVLTGAKKDVDVFERNYKLKAEIVGRVTGNYEHSFNELPDLAWGLVFKYQEELGKKMIEELREKIGQGRGVTGLKHVWKAVQEGEGLILLVEKDYQVAGFIAKENGHLYLRAPEKEHFILPDVVDELSKKMIHKKQRLFFVENGSLEEFGHIGLITRY